MRMVLTVVLGLGLAANGVWMLCSPESWYPVIPGVTHTGPLNVHFVRDIRCAYFLCDVALLGLTIHPASTLPAACLALQFPAFPDVVHLLHPITVRTHRHPLLRELSQLL